MKPDASRAADLVKVQREIGFRGGLHRFIKMAWHVVEPGRAFVDNWHIGAVCEHLEAVTRGQINRLAINVPPGCMKSLTCNVFWPVWDWIQDPAQRFFFASFDQRLVGQRDGGKCIELVHSPWFRARWHDRVQIATDAAAGEFYTQAKGMRFATSPGGRATGYHANKLVLDDLAKPSALTDDYLAELGEWRKQTLASRGLPGAAHVLIGQRLHENDPTGQVLKETKDDGSKQFEHLMLPMRYEGARACSTSIGFRDPRTVEGELLWPTYKNEEEVRQQEKDMGSQVTAAQLQQRPSPAGGLIFQRSWMTNNYYTLAPARFDACCLSFDFTFKDVSKRPGGKIDFVGCGAYGRKGADFYLVDLHVERLDFPGSLQLVKRKTREWPRFMAKLVEDKANGPAVISMLKKDVPGLIAVTPEGGKEARANAVAPCYEAGNVHYPHPDGAITNPETQSSPVKLPFVWDGKPCNVDPHVDSMAGFPFAAHDDDVDTETQAILYLRRRATKFLEAMQSLQRAGLR